MLKSSRNRIDTTSENLASDCMDQQKPGLPQNVIFLEVHCHYKMVKEGIYVCKSVVFSLERGINNLTLTTKSLLDIS